MHIAHKCVFIQLDACECVFVDIHTKKKKLHFTYAFTFKQYMIICIIYNYIFESGYDIHRLYVNDVIVSIIENKQMDIGSMCSYR